jgi:hypothetical protein
MATINGTNGGDSLYGGAAADVINGLNGNDTLKGFGGADRLDGGNGIDTVFYGLHPVPRTPSSGVILEPEVVYGTQTLCTRVQA